MRLHIRATEAMQFSKAQLEMGPASAGPDHATANVRAVAEPHCGILACDSCHEADGPHHDIEVSEGTCDLSHTHAAHADSVQ